MLKIKYFFGVIVILLSVFSGMALAQTIQVSGTVNVLLGNGKISNVPNATVNLRRDDTYKVVTVQSDANGKFSFTNITAKVRYTAWAVKSGYESIVEAGVLLKENITNGTISMRDPANKTLAGTAWKFNLPNKIFWTGNLVIGFPLDGDMPFFGHIENSSEYTKQPCYIPTGHVKKPTYDEDGLDFFADFPDFNLSFDGEYSNDTMFFNLTYKDKDGKDIVNPDKEFTATKLATNYELYPCIDKNVKIQ